MLDPETPGPEHIHIVWGFMAVIAAIALFAVLVAAVSS